MPVGLNATTNDEEEDDYTTRWTINEGFLNNITMHCSDSAYTERRHIYMYEQFNHVASEDRVPRNRSNGFSNLLPKKDANLNLLSAECRVDF